MKFQKILSMLLTIVMIVSLTACGSGTGAEGSAGQAAAEDAAAASAPDTVAAPEEAAAAAPAQEAPADSVLAANPELTNLDLDDTLQPGMYEGKSIVVGTRAGDFDVSLMEYARLFKELTGGDVEVQSIPEENLMEKTQLGLSSGEYDIVVTPYTYIHSFAAAGYICDLTEMMDTIAAPSFDKEDFVPGLYNTYANYGGQTVALPYKPDAQMFFYRKDLFEDETVKAGFREKYGRELTVPQTPEELVEVAAYFTKSENPDSPTDYGYSAWMNKGGSRFGWFNRLGYYGGKEFGDSYAPGFSGGSGEAALQNLAELVQYAPPDLLTFDWDISATFFSEGNSAMTEAWPTLYLSIAADDAPVKGKVGFAVVPGSSPTLGGWAIAVAADSTEQEMAFKFCEMATSKDGEILKIKYTMDLCRTSNYSRDIVYETISDPEFYTALMENLAVATQPADADIPYIAAQIIDIEETAVQATLAGDMTVTDAVAQMETEIKAAVDAIKDNL